MTAPGCSDTPKPALRSGRDLHADLIVDAHHSTGQYDAHHSRLTHDLSGAVAGQHGLEQAGLEAVDLPAGVPKAGYLDDGVGSDPQEGPLRQVQQVDAAGSDVFPEVAGAHLEAVLRQFVEQLRLDQVHLPQVGFRGVRLLPEHMLHGSPGMRVTVNAEPFHQQNGFQPVLAEVVLTASADREHSGSRSAVRGVTLLSGTVGRWISARRHGTDHSMF